MNDNRQLDRIEDYVAEIRNMLEAQGNRVTKLETQLSVLRWLATPLVAIVSGAISWLVNNHRG